MVIESRPICPFIGKECIACGVTAQSLRNGKLHPCMFFNEFASDSEDSCLIKQAVNRILKRPDRPDNSEKIDVPY